jgi:hypothetical protein
MHFAFGGEKGCKIASPLSSIAFGCAQERPYCGGFCAPAGTGDVPARRAQEGKEEGGRGAPAHLRWTSGERAPLLTYGRSVARPPSHR